MKQRKPNKTPSMQPQQLPGETLDLARAGQPSDERSAPVRARIVSNPPGF
jgi:hypothetical protein